jgi:hypothetical protein
VERAFLPAAFDFDLDFVFDLDLDFALALDLDFAFDLAKEVSDPRCQVLRKFS